MSNHTWALCSYRCCSCFGTVIIIAIIATTTNRTLNIRPIEAAKRMLRLSVLPIAMSANGANPDVWLNPVNIAAEIATPKAAPKEDAILYMPEADPADSCGTFDRAASIDGLAYSPNPMPNSVKPIKATIELHCKATCCRWMTIVLFSKYSE